MTTKEKLVWGGLGLLALAFVCCVGIALGAALSKRDEPASPLAVPSLSPTSPPITVVVLEPSPAPTQLIPSHTPTVLIPPPTSTPIVIGVTATPLPPEPPTSVPTLPPATPVPRAEHTNPAAGFQALLSYAQAIEPILHEGLAAAERDGDILQASEQNPDTLCGGGFTPHPTLAADAALMDDLVNRLNQITPPADAAESVHRPLVESVRLWGEALDNINLSCQSNDPAGQGLLRLGAVLQLGGSMLNFHIASDNFWRLVVVNGLEAIVGSPPP